MDSKIILFWDWRCGLDSTCHNLPAPLCNTKDMRPESLEHEVTKEEIKKKAFPSLDLRDAFRSLELAGCTLTTESLGQTQTS